MISLVRGANDEGGAIIHATPEKKRSEYARRIAGIKRERGTDSSIPEWARNPSMLDDIDIMRDAHQRKTELMRQSGISARAAGSMQRESLKREYDSAVEYRDIPKGKFSVWLKGWKSYGRNPAKFDRCVKKVKKRGGAANAYAVCTAAGTRKKKRNPAEGAAAMSESFHGRPVLEVKEVDETVHYHKHLGELGELERLKVRALDGGIVKLSDFDGALLCCSEADGDGYSRQLYIRGGDQSVDPEDFAVEEPFHDKEELGEVLEIRYFTVKEHLGKDGGEATYYHEFGEEDKENGRRARRPKLVYSTRDGRLSLVGGAYKIGAEGIVN